ncbi:MAG: hypothetical protein QG672_1725 [Pseudomonadota bacterium]|nr:hypothetical protein [Pseudomonadota bacterium]
MSDIYDTLLDQQQAQPAAPAVPSLDIYDQILDGERQAAQRAMQPVLDMATKVQPERAASAQGLAKSTGLPVEIVERNFDEVQRREQIRNMQDILGRSPVLARQMMDPEFAKLAHQDLEPLSGIEGVATFFKNSGRAMVGGLYDASAGVVGIGQSAAELLQFATKPLAGRVLPTDVGGMIARDLSAYRQGIEAEAKRWTPQADGVLSGGWYSGLSSLSRNLASLPLLFAPGGQGAALAGMTLPVAGAEYGKGRDAGLGVGPALTFGASQGLIEYATELIPVTKLLGDLKAGASLPRMLANQIAAEIPGEQVATILQDLHEWAAIDANAGKAFGDYLAERPSAAAQTLIATIVGTAGQTTIISGVDAAMRRAAGEQRQAEQAENMAQRLAELVQFSRAAALTQTSPETFQQFVEQATEDGPVTDVFIDANVLMQSGVAEQLAAVSPAVAEQLQDAIDTGGLVRIPVAEFAARIAPTELADGLLEHLKTEPDGMSRAEAGQYLQGQVERLQQELGDTIEQTGAALAERVEVETVRNTIRDELNAINRFRPDVNEAYATLVGEFFGSMAQRVGMTPEQLFEKYRLRTVAESVAGGQQFDQASVGQPLDAVRSAWRDAGIDFTLVESGDVVTVSKIVVPEGAREAGAGTRAMEQLVTWADANGKHLALTPSADFGGNAKRLTAFYKRFGFKENKGKSRVFSVAEGMVREAKNGPTLYQSGALRTDTPAFRAWFGDSKVADENGEPLVVYHGTGADITAFDEGAVGANFGDEAGFYFTNNTRHSEGGNGKVYEDMTSAGAYAKNAEGAPNIMPVYVALQNPKIIEGRSDGGGVLSLIETPTYSAGQALLDALDEGFDGIIVRDMATTFNGQPETVVIASRPEQIKSATGNRGTYDPSDPNILHQFAGPQAATRSAAPRASFNPATNTIALLRAADLSSFLHESGHFFLEVMTDMAASVQTYDADQLTEGERGVLRDVQALMQWFGLRDLNEWSALDFEEKRAYHEKFAESFELYLTEGNAPSIELQPLFGRFRAWLLNVYRSIKDFLARNPAAGALSDDVRRVFDRMLATDQAIKTAEQARSLMPLFASAQQAGMTEEEFAAYQALGQEATEAAQEDLGARGMRDMQWLAGARSRALKRLQKEAAALREQMEMEARREVLSQPVYRAWQFLTGKLTADDRLPKLARPKSDPDVVDPALDSLFVAVAKLGGIDRAELEEQWGLDPKEKIAQQGFGKHVLRRNGGRSIDDMRAALVQYGYLDANEGGADWNPRELEDRFFEELAGAPQYSSAADFDALQDMRPGDHVANIEGLMAGRLDRAELTEIGLPAEIIEHLRGLRMTAKDGLHPDLVAELFGFTSGDELVRTLAAAQPPAVEIEALTDLRMIERHGDLASPEALARAADRAIHNDVRARMVATELDALAKATGRPRVMMQAAREYARQMVDRLLVRNVKPGQYAAAEARAGKAATQAMKAGDLEHAAAEKRNQLVQNQAARAAHRVLDEIEAGLRYLKKFDGDGTRKSIDADYLEQIDTLLERFDLRKGQSMRAIDKRTALAKWIEERANEGTEPDIPEWLQAEAARTHCKNLTVEQFRGLIDSVRQIEHLGRLKNKLLTARDARALDAIVAEITASMEAAAGGRTIDNERRNTLASQVQHAARGFMAMHRQMHSLVREMDGYQDGGPLWNVLVRTMNEAGEREASMRADATRRLHALIKPLLAEGGKMGGKGQHFPSLGRSLNRGERLAIALNWGNEGNRQRLLDGRGWTAERVMPVLQTLTPAEWQFVQGVWDFFESYRPQVAEKEKRVTGKEPEWIEPAPFTIEPANGGAVQMRGGYYPIKYDPMQSGEAAAHADAESAKQMMRAAYTAATTRRSYTKGRADRVMNRPLLLSFDGIYQGANEVIHDLSWHEWLIDANKILRRLDAPMRQHFGAEKVTAIKRAMEDIARGDQPATTAFERTLGHLRSGATIAGLGWNLRTALLQPLGLTNSIVRVGPAWIARGLREFYGSPAHMARKVEEAQAKSEFLRNRMRTMNREINDVVNRLDKGKSDTQLAIESSFFILIQKTQALVDYPTWYGAFEKAMADPALRNEDGTIDEAKAVAMADQAVIAAQSGGQAKDLAQIQRGGPLLKLFTNFYSYFAATLQLAVERTGQTNFKKLHEVLRLAGDYLLLMVVPVIGSVIINALMKGAPDDDEWLEQIIEEQIGFLMGLFPLTREMTSAVQAATGFGGQFGYSGPAGLRFFSDLYRLGAQVGQGEFDMAAFKAANNTAGVLFHYPAGQVNRTVEGTVALIEGRTDNPLAVIAGPPPRN